MNAAGRADADVFARGDPEAEQEEDGDRDPEDRVAKLVADFEPAIPKNMEALRSGRAAEVERVEK